MPGAYRQLLAHWRHRASLKNMHGLQRHRRRQVWHSLAVLVQGIGRARAAEEATAESEEEGSEGEESQREEDGDEEENPG